MDCIEEKKKIHADIPIERKSLSSLEKTDEVNIHAYILTDSNRSNIRIYEIADAIALIDLASQ